MRPTPVQPAMNRSRRRRLDLTLPIPQRDPCIALPPPNSASCAPSQLHQQMPNPSELERVRRIGSGSVGTVYMVRHRPTGKIYALKVIYGNHEDAVRRQICREIEILWTVDNPYVVRCHGMFENAGAIQILLEYMERGSLDSRGPMPEPFLAEVARQILNGIAYLHRRKIVHHDIKPSNLLINDRNQVKVADYGVSRILAQTMDPCNSSVATIAYMSPERINTDLKLGAYDGYAGDIWSLGLSILECYLGRFPFAVAKQGDWASLVVAICYSQPPEAPTTASPEFRHFVGCCLQKDPARRWTAGHLLQHPFVLRTTAGNQEEDDGVDMENQMENQLSLNITSHRAQLLLDKLNGLSLPFTGRINVVEMKESLMKIQEAFTGEDDSKLGDGSVISGAEKLKEAVYEVEDVLDEYGTESLETQISQPPSNTKAWIADISASLDVHLKNNKPFSGSISSGSPYSRLEFITETLGSLIRDMVMGLTVLEKGGKSEEEESQIIHSFPEKIELAQQVYGREAEKEEIVQLLINKNEHDLLFIPIVGGEGIGKTTLACLAFNDERVKTHFELKLWIQASNFDLLTVIREVIKAVTGSNRDILDRGELQRRIHGALGGTLFLLVLDDVRDVSMIDGLINFLSCVGSGSRILLTTTLLHFDSSESNTRPFNLKGLSDEDCWSLFSQRAFDNPIHESDPTLVTIGRDIMKMCKGVPLFVKMYAGILYFQREESEWQLVREGVMRKYGPDFHLRLCFSHLKPHLKQCFAFCSLFPEGCEIDKETLTQLWMANDLVPARDGMELEDVGHEIFSELVVRSFFQEIQHPLANVTTFKVHNLLHGLARRAMGFECAYAQECHLMNFSRFRHLSLPSSSLEFPVTLSQAWKLRTFILLPLHLEFRHFWSDVSSLHGTITCFPVLRVLDLRGWKENPLPMEIISLKFLRYLDLSYASVVNLPAAVSTLINLQTLKLRECQSLCQLPEGMKNMINLRYLDIRGCNLLTHIPPKIGQLRCLQVLSLFIVGNKTSECSDMEELQHLKLRGSLQIKHLERVKHPVDAQRANLLGKPNLGELHLCWRDYNEGEEGIDDDKDTFGVHTETEVLEGLQPHQKLEKLWITDYMGIHFPGWLMGSQLQNLVEIRLYRCRRCEYLPPFGQLPSLKVLCIENLDAVEYIGNEFYGNGLSEGFPSLEMLKIRYMLNLEAWLELQGKEAFLRLSKLEVAFCEKLTTMPCFPSIKDLFLDEIDSMLLSSVADCTSLESLTIHSISGLMSLPEGLLQNLTSLRSLKISHCENLVHLPAQLQNLTSLELFSLSHCAGLVSLPDEGIQGLASLKELKIEHCKNLADLSKGLQHLTTLRMLHVNWCDKLEYLLDGLQYLTNLRHLSLFYCEGLKTLPEGIGSLSSLEVLTFGSPKLTTLPDAIKNLSSLQVLMIRSLSLTSLPKGLQQLTTLRELFIGSCPQLVSLPEWLENLKSLESLYIMSCPSMTSLPAGLQHLTSLRRLLIHECPNLNIRCKFTGEDWHKIQHIPSFVIE